MDQKKAIVCGALCVFLAHVTQAQEEAHADAPVEQQSSWSSTVDFDASTSFDASFDTAGSVQATRTGAQWNLTGKLSDTRFLMISPRYEVSLFDFSGATSLSPSGDVLDTGHQFSVTVLHTTVIDDTWSWIVGGVVSLGFEEGADAGDALTGAGFFAVRRQHSEDLSWILGAGMVTRLEDDALVFPYIGIDWAINDTLGLHSQGTSIRLDATLEDELIFYSALGWTTREFRLDDSNTVAGGAFQENIWQWSLGIETTQLEKWRFRVEAGIILAHRIEIFNSGGTSVGIADADPVGYIGLQINRHF